jgi:hypothetical protein
MELWEYRRMDAWLDGIHPLPSSRFSAVKTFLIESWLVTESAVLWAVVLLIAGIIGLALALRQQGGCPSPEKLW